MGNYRILVTGALGQIGRVLVERLVLMYGNDAVLATDLAAEAPELPCDYEALDATSTQGWMRLVARHSIRQVYHLVAILSARAEARPFASYDTNMEALRLAIGAIRAWDNCRLFFPSSIAVYGPPLPQCVTEHQALFPTTSYGISKVSGELWANYVSSKFGCDVRCLRLPGVIGYQTDPGGGTTDYAVEIFHRAVQHKDYTCFLAPDTRLPMIYMDDVVRGITEVMQPTRAELLAARTADDTPGAVYNLPGFSVTPAELTAAIRQHLPDFNVTYQPDFRQAIADSWPAALDGAKATRQWNWKPAFDLETTTDTMLSALQLRTSSVN